MVKRRLKAFCIFLCAVLLIQSSACSESVKSYYFNMPYSSNGVYLNLCGGNSQTAYREMQKTAYAIDEQLSGYRYGDVEKFNRADGDIFENGINILGVTEYKVKVDVGFYTYESVLFGRKMFIDTNGAFSITTKRLKERWRSATALPDKTLLMRDTSGLQNPLLIEAKTIGGRYYLEKDVMFMQSGELSDEHAFITSADFICGYTLDKLASVAARSKLSSAEISVGSSKVFLGGNPDSKTGKWSYSSYSDNYGLLCEIAVPANSFVSEVDISKNSHTLFDGTYIGGVINPSTGYPTTMIQADTGDYVQSGSYVTKAIVVGKSGATCDALATAACVLDSGFSDIAKNEEVAAVLFTSDGKMYVVGNMEILQNKDALYNKYVKITL